MARPRKPTAASDPEKLAEALKIYDGKKQTATAEAELEKTVDQLIACGEPAVPFVIKVMLEKNYPSCLCAASALAAIGDASAIPALVDMLEDRDVGSIGREALELFGPSCIPAVIDRIKQRIARPLAKEERKDLTTNFALGLIGDIQCDESVAFLNGLLDDYISEMPDEPFETSEYEWKYACIEFFVLLDALVKQQDKRAIPHIRKARDCFPREYTDHIICRIAIDRIQKGITDRYLPMDALEIQMPSGGIMEALSGEKTGWKKAFKAKYGKYLPDNENDQEEEDDSLMP